MNQNRFGRKTEQMPVPEQLAFTDVDGELVLFNEAEVLAALDEREKETIVKKTSSKEKRKTRRRPFRDTGGKSRTLSDRERTGGSIWKGGLETAA